MFPVPIFSGICLFPGTYVYFLVPLFPGPYVHNYLYSPWVFNVSHERRLALPSKGPDAQTGSMISKSYKQSRLNLSLF